MLCEHFFLEKTKFFPAVKQESYFFEKKKSFQNVFRSKNFVKKIGLNFFEKNFPKNKGKNAFF